MHVGVVSGTENDDFQRRRVCLEKFRARRGGVAVELVNDVDGLRRRAQLLHERVVGGHVVGVHSRPVNEVVKLDAEEHFAVLAEFAAQFARHGGEVGLLLQGLPEEGAQLGIDRLRVVVAQEAQTRIDFLLEQFPVHAGEAGENLDEQWQKIGGLGHRARTPQGAAQQGLAGAACAVKIAQCAFQSPGEAGGRQAVRDGHGAKLPPAGDARKVFAQVANCAPAAVGA